VALPLLAAALVEAAVAAVVAAVVARPSSAVRVRIRLPDAAATARIAGAILEVNGILYFSAPDNAWAVDARTGRTLWHYFWKTKGGTHIGNRGLGMYGNWLYLETPDDYLVSLDARTGKERWHKVISDFSEQYFSTVAPVVIGNHILVGTGDDIDSPGYLQSVDPETGDLQWKKYLVPMKEGDPGLDTWQSLDAAQHGGAQPWIPGAYDPETHLYIIGTGNPTPAYTKGRDGDNLYTCSLVALDVDTGNMKWYFQTHRTKRTIGIPRRRRPDRRHVQRQNAQAGPAGHSQRLLLCAGPRHWRAPGHQPVLSGELGV
jgi:glucose dehydrogenase